MIRRTRWYCPLTVALVCLGSAATQPPVTNDIPPISFMGKLGQVDYKARTVVLGDPDRSPASPATPGAPAAVKRFRLAEKVAISVDGKKAELKDLRPGLFARVQVRMDASRGDNVRIEGGPRTPRDPETGNPISVAERIEAFTRAPGSGASDRDR